MACIFFAIPAYLWWTRLPPSSTTFWNMRWTKANGDRGFTPSTEKQIMTAIVSHEGLTTEREMWRWVTRIPYPILNHFPRIVLVLVVQSNAWFHNLLFFITQNYLRFNKLFIRLNFYRNITCMAVCVGLNACKYTYGTEKYCLSVCRSECLQAVSHKPW